MEVRALTQPEQKYTYSQSTQIAGQTGCIGHLRGDFAPLAMAFILLGLTPESNGNRTSLRRSLTRLSTRSVKIRGFCITAMI